MKALAWVGLGGGLAFLAGYPAELPWLLLVAFVPLLHGCVQAGSWRGAAGMGAVFALARFIPLGIMLDGLGVPALPAVALALYLVALDAGFAVGVFAMRRWSAAAFALGAGAVFALFEEVDALLPMWGTSRSLARSWAVVPEVFAGVLRLGGPSLVALLIVSLQALVVVVMVHRRPRRLVLAVPLVLVVPFASLYDPPAPSASLRVGVVAWARSGERTEAERLVGEAAAEGARLVVLPEGAFEVLPGEREAFDTRWSAVAHHHRIHLVVGFIDRDQPGNRLAVFGPEGELVGQYTKTHLIPLAETVPPGPGELLVFEVDGVRVGTMICQDDNFRDLTAAYVEAGAQLVVVPTNEGPPAVAPYHYRNARLRPMEYPVALVRSAAKGTSAVVAPGGEVVAEIHHPEQGPRALVADVPVEAGEHPRQAT